MAAKRRDTSGGGVRIADNLERDVPKRPSSGCDHRTTNGAKPEAPPSSLWQEFGEERRAHALREEMLESLADTRVPLSNREDAVDEAFVQLLLHGELHQLLDTELHARAREVCEACLIKQLREDRRHRRGQRRLSRALPEDGAYGHTGGEEAISNLQMAKLRFRFLQELPPPYRAVIALRFIEEKTDEEAAKTLGLPLGTYKSRLKKARNRVRERFRELAAKETQGTMAPSMHDRWHTRLGS